MQLTIDIGNTELKFALFENENKEVVGRGLAELTKAVSDFPILKVLIANVAVESEVLLLLNKHNISYQIVSHKTALPIQNLYQTPETLGADRVAVAVAAASLFPDKNVLIICAGSCITYNFVTDKKAFLGGAISPGIAMRFKALKHFTAKLPWVEMDDTITDMESILVGKNTESSILSGVLNGAVQEVQGTIEQYRARYADLKVLLTGGNASFFVSNLKNEIFARPDLVLEGLNRILLYHA